MSKTDWTLAGLYFLLLIMIVIAALVMSSQDGEEEKQTAQYITDTEQNKRIEERIGREK